MSPESLMLALLGLMVGALAGIVCVAPFDKSGPKAVRMGTIASCLVGMLIIWVGSLVGQANNESVLIGIPGALTCIGLGVGMAYDIRRKATKIISLAGTIRDAVSTNFGGFDVDDDQVISNVDLDRILSGDAPLPAGVSRELVAHMRDQINHIGHEVGKYTTTAGRSTVTHTVAVISPRDVSGYPDRVAATYHNWMPSQTKAS